MKKSTIEPQQQEQMLNTITMAGEVNQNIVGTLKLLAEGDTRETPRIVKVLQDMLEAVSGIISLLHGIGLTRNRTTRSRTEANV